MFVLTSCLQSCIELGPSDEESDTSGPAPFGGTWTRGVSDCIQARIFGKKDGAFAYEVDLLCQLTTGGAGVQAETGTYNFDPESGVTTFTPNASTCAGLSTADYTQTLALNGATTLVAQTRTGTEIYESSGAFVLGPNVTTGCFTADGGFEPAPLSAL